MGQIRNMGHQEENKRHFMSPQSNSSPKGKVVGSLLGFDPLKKKAYSDSTNRTDDLPVTQPPRDLAPDGVLFVRVDSQLEIQS